MQLERKLDDRVLVLMFKQIRKYILVCSALMLIIFSVYYTMVAMYTHFHIINGVTVMHAHPFHGQHTHSQGQLFVLDFFSHFYTDEVGDTICFTTPVRPLLYTLKDQYESPFVQTDYTDGIYRRGPPIFHSCSSQTNFSFA